MKCLTLEDNTGVSVPDVGILRATADRDQQ